MTDDPNNPNNPENQTPLAGDGGVSPVDSSAANNPPPQDPPPPPPYTPGVDTPPVEPRLESGQFDIGDEEMDDSEVLHTNRGSSVAINPGAKILLAAVFIIIFGMGIMILSGGDAPPSSEDALGSSPSAPAGSANIAPPSAVPRAIDTPAPPMLNIPTSVAPPPPPPPPPPAAVLEPPTGMSEPLPIPDDASSQAVPPPPPPPAAPEMPTIAPLKTFGGDNQRRQRMQASMLVVAGGSAKEQEANKDQEVRSNNAQQILSGGDPNIAYMNNVLQITHSPKAGATRLNDLNHTIAQGKIIDAVLETAINTDLPGLIRAIVSRDVYAEASKNVLVPKGSRLIGQYNTSVFRGQKRVMVVWTRLIRPDGVDIAIGSPATDSMGRAGVNGLVDNKYMETFSTAILTTMLSIGVAVGTDNIIDDTGSTTRNTDGSTTSTGSSGAEAASEAVGNLGDVAKSVVQNHLDLRPTITVDQGTRVNVFVNQDLVFDDEALAGGNSGVFE